jgi:hypothetical protein
VDEVRGVDFLSQLEPVHGSQISPKLDYSIKGLQPPQFMYDQPTESEVV